MTESVLLSKESSESEIKAYFNAVLELSKSDNEFPVNLDEVWMLVYGRKSDATEALQRDFMEGIDYKVLRQNPQNPNGGRPTNDYCLTVPCMEYFIARKVRPVFEVYRQVFHRSAKQDDTPEEIMARALIVAQDTIKRKEERVRQLEAQTEQQQTTIEIQTQEIKKAAPKVEYFDNVLQSQNSYTTTQMAKELGFRTGAQLHGILREKGIMYYQSQQWLLTAKYSGNGYTKTRTSAYTRSDGTQGTNVITVWSEKGRLFLNGLKEGGKI